MMEQNYMMIALRVLGALGLLIYGMRMMSEALQKMAGPQLRHILAKMTTNRLTGDRNIRDMCRSIIVSHHRDDGIVCECRITDSGTGDIRYYGSQYWNYADSLDYVTRLFCRLDDSGVPSVSRRHDLDLQETISLCGRFPFRDSVSLLITGYVKCSR